MKRQMEVSQHCWKFIYKHSDISIFAVCHRFFFFFTCTGVGKIFSQINSAAVAFIDILIAAWEGLKGNILWVTGLQKTDFLSVQTDFYFVKPIQFA